MKTLAHSLSSLLRILAALPLFCVLAVARPALADDAQPEPDRALAPAAVRHLLVKAIGQGSGPQEAADNAVKAARELAAARLKPLGGAQALAPGDDAQRVVTLKHFPQLGFSAARAVALVEFRLRERPEPLPAGSGLLVLRAEQTPAGLELSADAPAEAVVAADPGGGAEPELLPGGVQIMRLTPGKTLVLKSGRTYRSLTALACTGGLTPPADPATLSEALAKSRAGRPHPATINGVVSNCVELQPAPAHNGQRSMRQKGSEAPVNMTGAAGRDAGLPVSPAP